MRRLRALRRTATGSGQGKYVLASAFVLAVCVAPFAFASGEGTNARLGARNPSGGGELTRETQIIAENKTYGTRQSNKTNGDGGGAIYGCRSAAPPNGKAGTDIEPCLRGNNLTNGRAFEFNSVTGTEVGRITVGNDLGDNPNARPFSTNATGVAIGLNADRVDGLNASDLQPGFAVVAADGTLGDKRDAASVTHVAASGVYDVKFGSDISKCAYTATPGGATPSFVTATNQDANTVRVRTFNTATPPVPTDTAFHLVVNC
jgi:hypothetical protein